MSSDGSMTGDSGMVRVMAMVVLSLIGIAISIGLVANILGTANDHDPANDPVMRNALVERLEPIGRVRTSADDIEVADAGGDAPGVAVADAGAEKTGEELVQGACANCHAAGVAGAPLLDDADAWAERREKGYEALVASVIDGLNAMPARGGSTYTDEEIGRSVRHIAMFPEEEAASAEADGADVAAAPAAEGEGGEQVADAGDAVEVPETAEEAAAIPMEEATTDQAAVDGTEGDPVDASNSDPADESRPAPDAEAPANDMRADESAAMAGGDTNDMRADEAGEGVVTVRDPDAGPGVRPVTDKPGVETDESETPPVGTSLGGEAANGAEALADEALEREVDDEVATAEAVEAKLVAGGPAPEGMSDTVKAAVDGVCAGCHIAGVADAPKIGDVAAWQARADKGLETLTRSVIDGMGAMPARGGSNLSDEEIPTAIRYLMSKE